MRIILKVKYWIFLKKIFRQQNQFFNIPSFLILNNYCIGKFHKYKYIGEIYDTHIFLTVNRLFYVMRNSSRLTPHCLFVKSNI